MKILSGDSKYVGAIFKKLAIISSGGSQDLVIIGNTMIHVDSDVLTGIKQITLLFCVSVIKCRLMLYFKVRKGNIDTV